MFLIWEGVDKVGKDTIKALYDKRTQWSDVNLNRGPLGYMAYDKIHGRETEESVAKHLREWEMIRADSLTIYLHADSNTLYDRIEKAGDPLIEVLELDNQQSIYYRTVVQHCDPYRLICLDTSLARPEAICDAIDATVKQLRKASVMTSVRQSGAFTHWNIDGVMRTTFYKPYERTFTCDELMAMEPFDLDVDRYYYEKLETECLHTLYCYGVGLKNLRQLVVTENDCISFVQFAFPINGRKNGPLSIYVDQRSWDLGRHGTNDLTFFVYLVARAVDEGLIPDEYAFDFNVHYRCVFPHDIEVVK